MNADVERNGGIVFSFRWVEKGQECMIKYLVNQVFWLR